MSRDIPTESSHHALQRLREAVGTGDPDAVLAAIPEPPHLLSTLFSLDIAARDAILAGVFPVFDTDEDRWELIEAAAMDSVARPERGAFIAVAPYIPLSLLDEARTLAQRLPNGAAQRDARNALEARAAALGITLAW